MCIIAHKPKGSDMPSNKLLKTCWEGNEHGAGIMYYRDGHLYYEKGFMKFKDLKLALKMFAFGKDDDVAIHFRLRTSGETDPGNTHPFPVTSKISALRSEHGAASCLLMHNGIFGKGEELLSDTGCFVRDVLAPVAPAMTWPGIDSTLYHICNMAGQRILLFYLDRKGALKVLKTGSWNVLNGISYSNYGYIESSFFVRASNKYVKGRKSYWGSKAWWEDDDTSVTFPPNNGLKQCEICTKSDDCYNCEVWIESVNYAG